LLEMVVRIDFNEWNYKGENYNIKRKLNMKINRKTHPMLT